MKKTTRMAALVDRWAAEGLITPEQATVLKARLKTEEAALGTAGNRVQASEIAVYLGSVVVFLALAFVAILNWQELGSAGRVLVIAVPTVAMFALGSLLSRASGARARRGAQALWLGGGLLSGVAFLVLFHELHLIDWQERGPTDFHFTLGALLAGVVSALAFWRLPTRVQSVPFHLWLSVALLSFIGWLEFSFPPFDAWRTLLIGLGAGAAWLVLDAWLTGRDRERLAQVSRLVGAVTFLATPFLLAGSLSDIPWQRAVMESISFVACVAFIVASLRRQSQIFLYSGAVFLLLLITYLNFEHFAGEVGLPVALFVSGVVLIALGLGTGRLSRRMAM